MTQKRKRAALYLRQSKARDDSISLEIQEEACRAHANAAGFEVNRVVVDEGVSGYRPWEARPSFPALVESAEEREFDVLVVYRWSRLSRNRVDQAHLIQLFEEKLGVPVESATESFDTTTAGGFMGREQMLLYAAFESKLKSDQWKEAQRRRLEKGLPTSGHARFGYRRVTDDRGKTVGYEPDPGTAPLLAEAYRRYVSGSGFPVIAAWLNSKGATTTAGTAWSVRALPVTMDSGFGAGWISTGRRSGIRYDHQGKHEAIIDAALWASYLEERARRRGAPAKAKSPAHYLIAVARCGLCGGRLVSHTSTYNGRSYMRLRCARRVLNPNDCDGVSVSRDWLELKAALWISEHQAHIKALLGDAGTTEQAVRDARSRCEDLRDLIAGIDTRLGQLASGWAEGLLDSIGYRVATERANEERAAAKSALASAIAEAASLDSGEVDGWGAMFEQVDGEWDHGVLAARIAKVARKISVHRDRIEIEPMMGDTTMYRRTLRRSRGSPFVEPKTREA